MTEAAATAANLIGISADYRHLAKSVRHSPELEIDEYPERQKHVA